jgi:hypothetical protein
MYFRQEATKALWQYNGADICYNRDFLKVQPKQQFKSADFPHNYYARQDKINNIEDSYVKLTYTKDSDYRHLSGAEIVYYPNRQEYRIWNHAQAVSVDDLLDTTDHWKKENIDSDNIDNSINSHYSGSRSIIGANCRYVEDRWKVTINPILVRYKNEQWMNNNKPKLPIMNSPIPDKAWEEIQKKEGTVEFPPILLNKKYDGNDIDYENWEY